MSVNGIFSSPINVAIAVPNSNCLPCSGSGTGAKTPTPGTAGGTPTSVTMPQCAQAVIGNGITAINNNILSVIALESMPAYTTVVMGAGGVKAADKTKPEQQDILVGVTMQESKGGQPTVVLCFGILLSNPVVGTAGWNFVMNQPVFLGTAGTVVQSTNGVGFVKRLGFALSASVILARVAEVSSAVPTTPTTIQDVVQPATGNTLVSPEDGGTYRIGPVTADVNLTLKFDKMPGNQISKFKLLFATDRLPHTVNSTYASNGAVAGLTFALSPTNNEGSYLVEAMYDPTTQKAAVLTSIKY